MLKKHPYMHIIIYMIIYLYSYIIKIKNFNINNWKNMIVFDIYKIFCIL